MKKVGLLCACMSLGVLAGAASCSSAYQAPTSSYEKVKTAFNGVEKSFENMSTKRTISKKKPLKAVSFSENSIDKAFNLLTTADINGQSVEELSYNEPPMVQFQCLNAAIKKIGSGYEFGTKYYDDISGTCYINPETLAKEEGNEEFKYNYLFRLSLDIQIDTSDLITADVSFDIKLTKGSVEYVDKWYVSMTLDYNMNQENPTYKLSMYYANVGLYGAHVYEYDYVDVRESSINEWRKLGLEASESLIKDSSHQSLSDFEKDGFTYKVSCFSWYKNGNSYKPTDANNNPTRKQRITEEFYKMGLNDSDIDGTEFKNKNGTKTAVISEIYNDFSKVAHEDIIYNILVDEDPNDEDDGHHDDGGGEKEEERIPTYIAFSDRKGEIHSADYKKIKGDPVLRDLFNNGDYWDDGEFLRLLVMDQNNEVLRSEDAFVNFEFKLYFNGESRKIAMQDRISEIIKSTGVKKLDYFDLAAKDTENDFEATVTLEISDEILRILQDEPGGGSSGGSGGGSGEISLSLASLGIPEYSVFHTYNLEPQNDFEYWCYMPDTNSNELDDYIDILENDYYNPVNFFEHLKFTEEKAIKITYSDWLDESTLVLKIYFMNYQNNVWFYDAVRVRLKESTVDIKPDYGMFEFNFVDESIIITGMNDDQLNDYIAKIGSLDSVSLVKVREESDHDLYNVYYSNINDEIFYYEMLVYKNMQRVVLTFSNNDESLGQARHIEVHTDSNTYNAKFMAEDRKIVYLIDQFGINMNERLRIFDADMALQVSANNYFAQEDDFSLIAQGNYKGQLKIRINNNIANVQLILK